MKVPLVYGIKLTRNEQGLWVAMAGDMCGRPSTDLRVTLIALADLLVKHEELVDFMLSSEVYERLTGSLTNQPQASAH